MRLPLRTEWSGLVATVTATPTNGAQPHCAEMLRRRRAYDIARLTAAATLIPELREAPCWIRQLVVAADSFLIARPVEGKEKEDQPSQHGESIIAGYPWFSDWGRDAMIALPGLTLATGRYASARDILTTFARFADQGMLPNTFPDRVDNGEPPQ